MMLEFLDAQAKTLPRRDFSFASVESWHSHRTSLLRKLRHSLGLSLFSEKYPLNAQLRGVIEKETYRLEKVIFESWPGMPVTAHLYLPQEIEKPVPGILYACGHWMENGKLEPDIQAFGAGMAQLGCGVLIYDPMGQGERLGSWRDHGHLELYLVGSCQQGLLVWESMRAIDYLVERPEIDPQRMGMTGSSGGGTNTIYTSAVDQRIAVSIPVCSVATFDQILKMVRDNNWDDGEDLCNQLPEILAYSDSPDLIAAFAPKPLQIINSTNDLWFPLEGTRQTYELAQEIYRLYGVKDRISLAEIDMPHGYSRPMREAAYGWFSRWLLDRGDGAPIAEPDFAPLEAPYPEHLTYIVMPQARHLADLRHRQRRLSTGCCLAETDELLKPGPAVTAWTAAQANALPPGQEVSRRTLQTVLGLSNFPPYRSIEARVFKQVIDRGLFAERVEYESEPGILTPAMLMLPDVYDRLCPLVIYVGEWGKMQGLSNGTFEVLLEHGWGVFAVDVRGLGETATNDFYASTTALMTDRPLLGQRVFDVLRAVDYVWQRIPLGIQIDEGRVGCWGEGAGAILALFAAALDQRISAAVALSMLDSFKSLILERPDWPASLFLFDVLNHFDLPDVAKLVTPRPLLLGNVVDGRRQPVAMDYLASLYNQSQGLKIEASVTPEEAAAWLASVNVSNLAE
jgi:cephalosporin-C deacetylase-like acetyl esterase